MEDPSLHYFKEERRYLNQEGKRFAKAYPAEAGHLDLTSWGARRDPNVERMLEGFAFLAGRIHERLDDELPEYTEGLFELLWPHFLKPVPALSIAQLEPIRNTMPATMLFERGNEVSSAVSVGQGNAKCRFTTTQNVYVQPLHLKEVSLSEHSVQLRFELDVGIAYQELWTAKGHTGPVPLRLYFDTLLDEGMASTMYLYFTKYAKKVRYTADGAEPLTLRAKEGIQPVWCKPQQEEDVSLLHTGSDTFSAFQLLQEYLCFRHKFWFMDLIGLEKLEPPQQTRIFTVEVFFKEPYPEDKRFEKENIRLHCTPIVNRFRFDADTIRVENLVSEYRVVPSKKHEHSIEVYDLLHVEGKVYQGKDHDYTPFFRYGHAKETSGMRYYTTKRRMTEVPRTRGRRNPTPKKRYDVYLSLVKDGYEAQETLTLKIRCTNGNLPSDLGKGDIKQLDERWRQNMRLENLFPPTSIRYPPTQNRMNFLWQLISHMSLNYESVADRGRLVELLQLYDWTRIRTRAGVNQQRLQSIQKVEWEPDDWVAARGAVMRGAHVTLSLQEGGFPGEGAQYLFGEVMSVFFSMYATINSFVRLDIETSSGLVYEGTPLRGRGKGALL